MMSDDNDANDDARDSEILKRIIIEDTPTGMRTCCSTGST